MRRLVVVIAGLWLSTVPLGAAERTRTVPLTIDVHGGVLLQAEVNGQGPYVFMLDTGASRTIVAERLARQLNAPVVAKSEVVTVTGSQLSLVVRLGSVAVGGTRVDHLLAPVLADARLAQAGLDVVGVLGQDFLSAFNYTLDYRQARLTWDEPLTCGVSGAVPLVEAEGRFVMALEGTGGGRIRLVPDSGAEVAVLFTAAAPRRPTSTIPRVQVGDVTMNNLQAYFAERTDANADGLLPLRYFSSVSFAARGACLIARR
jgi:predicted aspartyl protease